MKITDLADFENSTFSHRMIREWAQSDTGGALPQVSAYAFTEWLDGAWNDYDDGSGTLTNEDILTSALDYWMGKA